MKDLALGSTAPLRVNLKRRVDMFDNDWGDQLDEELHKQFHEKTYPKVKLMEDTSMNIFRRIVREICSVYKEPSVRALKGASPEQQESANVFFRKIKLDQTMQVAHRYAKAATISFIVVRPINEEGEIVLRVLTPDQVYVEANPEDPSEMTLFAYSTEVSDPKGKQSTIWIAYSQTERWLCDAKGNALTKDPRTDQEYDMENSYGVIPAVAFPAEFQVRSFYSPSWNRDAAEANLKIGLMLTYMNYLVKTQSFKQITINAESVAETLKDQILDPLFPLMLSGGATATTLDLNTQLGAIDQVIRGKVSAIANNYGISNENFTLTNQAASGFSLKIANQALQDIREADIPLCASVEQELFEVLAKVSGRIPEGVEVQFNPGEVTWPEEWTTEEARWNFEFKNGLASPVDYLLAKDPQKSREEAAAYIKTRQAEIRALKPTMSAWDLVAGGDVTGAAVDAPGAGMPAGGNAGLALASAASPKAPTGETEKPAAPEGGRPQGAPGA